MIRPIAIVLKYPVEINALTPNKLIFLTRFFFRPKRIIFIVTISYSLGISGAPLFTKRFKCPNFRHVGGGRHLGNKSPLVGKNGVSDKYNTGDYVFIRTSLAPGQL